MRPRDVADSCWLVLARPSRLQLCHSRGQICASGSSETFSHSHEASAPAHPERATGLAPGLALAPGPAITDRSRTCRMLERNVCCFNLHLCVPLAA